MYVCTIVCFCFRTKYVSFYMMCSIFMLSATYMHIIMIHYHVCVCKYHMICTYMIHDVCIHTCILYIYICTCIHTLQKKKRFFRLNIKDNQSVHLVYIKVNTGNDRLKPFSVAGSLFVTLIEIYSFSSYPYIYIHVYTYITTLHNIIYVSQLITLNMKKQKHT